jgi:uncharacterized tellurite resistance protein B-like protein
MKTTLSKTERPPYLANVLGIANADEEFSHHEAVAFQNIAARIGADQNDIDKAWQLHRSGKTDLRFMQSPRIRMANMQDMITLALSDGGVSPEESAPIEKLAGTLKYSQTDMDIMVRRAELAVKKMAEQIAAAAPQEQAATGSAPAPIPVTTKPNETPVPEIPTDTIPSPSKMPDADTEHPAPRQVGDKAPDAASVGRCTACREASGTPAEYCFGAGSPDRNVWGCRLLNMDWKPGSDWLSHGHFREDGIFAWHRPAVIRQVQERLPAVRDCPYVDSAYVTRVAEVLPSLSSVSGHWRYRPAQLVTTSTHHAQQNDGITAAGTPVSGIDPTGTREAVKVIRRALRRASRTDVNVRLLR